MIRSAGIVLHALRYNDTQLIVKVFTEEQGIVSFMMRDTLQNGRRRKASSWQALSVVDIAWENQLQRSLQKPIEWTLKISWKSLPFHPIKVAMCLFLGDFLQQALKNEHENKTLYQFMIEALQWFDEVEEGFANFHVFLLLRMTAFLGFAPNISGWSDGKYFDLYEGDFSSVQPTNTYLTPEEAKYVALFWRLNIKLLDQIQLNGSTRRRLLEVLMEYYQIHINEFAEIKSLAILKELFQ